MDMNFAPILERQEWGEGEVSTLCPQDRNYLYNWNENQTSLKSVNTLKTHTDINKRFNQNQLYKQKQ